MNDDSETERLIFTLIFRKKFDWTLLFTAALKICMSKNLGDFACNQLEKTIEKELAAPGISTKEIARKKFFVKLDRYFRKLKYLLHLILLGLVLPINLKKIIEKIIRLLIYAFYTYVLKKKLPPSLPSLPDTIKVVFKEKLQPIKIPVKVPVVTPEGIPQTIDKIRMYRECKFFKEYVFTQRELMEEMNKGKGIRETVFDRISAYCTAEVERAVKRFVIAMQQQPVTEGLKVVMKEAKKVTNNLDLLQASLNNGKPRNLIDLKKFIFMSKDYELVMKCLDSYQLLLKNDTTPERLEFFRNHVLPDIFVVLCAIGKDSKKQ